MIKLNWTPWPQPHGAWWIFTDRAGAGWFCAAQIDAQVRLGEQHGWNMRTRRQGWYAPGTPALWNSSRGSR